MRIRLPLIVLVLCAFAAGCTQDQYAIERDFYNVRKQASSIFQNPGGTPPAELQKVVDDFNRFQEKYPQTNIAVTSQFTIVQLYVVTKEYDKARERLAGISSTYAKFPAICSEAAFMRGVTYEEQKEWDSALAQYKALIKDYPQTPRGLETPVYIAMHYKETFQPDKMIQALKDAVDHYQKLTTGSEKSPLTLQAQILLARCYTELKDWKKAVSALEVVTDRYKDNIRMDNILLQMADIYYGELKNTPRATEILNRIVQEYPKAPSGAAARSMLEKITKGK